MYSHQEHQTRCEEEEEVCDVRWSAVGEAYKRSCILQHRSQSTSSFKSSNTESRCVDMVSFVVNMYEFKGEWDKQLTEYIENCDAIAESACRTSRVVDAVVWEVGLGKGGQVVVVPHVYQGVAENPHGSTQGSCSSTNTHRRHGYA